jgi:hypothetical protein
MGPFYGSIDYAQPFRCPQATSNSSFQANFFAIVGKQTAWPVAGRFTLTDIGDGLENTILIAESCTLTAFWSQPDDFVFDQMSFAVNDPNRVGISSSHDLGPLVAFADGAVYHLHPQTPEHVVRALLTANGGEPMDRHQLIRDGLLR